MPNIDTLSINFKANGTDRAVTNIKNMAGAVKELSMSVRLLDVNKMEAFSQAMNNLKKSAPTKAQTDRMNAFVKTITASDLKTLDGEKLNSFAQSIETVKKALPGKQKTEQMTAFFNAISANSGQNLDFTKLGTLAATLDAIKKATPTKSQIERMTEFAGAVVTLSTAIEAANIGGFANDMSVLSQAVQAFKKSSVNSIANAVAAMQTLGQQAQQTASTINNATPKNSQGASMGDNKGALDNTKELVATLDRVQVKASGIMGILTKMGLAAPTKQFKTLEENAEKIRVKYDQLRATLQKALQTGEITSDSSDYKKKMAELDALRNKYDELILKQRELAQEGGAFRINPTLTNSVNAFQQGVSQTASILKNGLLAGIRLVSNSVKSFTSRIKSMGTALKNTVTGGNSATKMARKFANEIFRVSKMLKLMVTRMALRKVIAEVGNGFKSLAIHSDQFNDSVSGIMNASKKLGYSFSAMVSPLINALAPALIYIINIFTKLLNIVNQVIAALTGATTWERAKDFTDSWRDSIEGAGDAAKETEKKLKKTVLGFDELNQLQDNKDASSKNGNGIADMFETVKIDKKWKDIADWLKQMWKLGDFYDLGKEIGKKLRGMLESIPWEQIRKTANKLGRSLATLINGFVEVERLGYDIGKTIAQSVNTVFEFLNGFVHSLHWDSIGKFIADTFNGFFENIDWDLIKDTVVTGMAGLAESVQTFIDNFHWDNISDFVINGIDTISKGIKAFVDGIKWEELGVKMGEQLNKIMEGVDWHDVGDTLGAVIEAAVDWAYGLVTTFSVDDAVKALSDFLEGVCERVDAQKAGEALGTALHNLIEVIKKFWWNQHNRDLIKEEIFGFFRGIFNSMTAADWEFIASTAGALLLINSIKNILAGSGVGAKIGLTIAVAYAGEKFGGWLGKILTGDEAYDEYPVTMQIKWAVENFPTTLDEFIDRVKECADAWASMCTEAHWFIRILTTILNPAMASLATIYADIKKMRGVDIINDKEFSADEIKEVSDNVNALSDNLNDLISKAQEAGSQSAALSADMGDLERNANNAKTAVSNIKTPTQDYANAAEDVKKQVEAVTKATPEMTKKQGDLKVSVDEMISSVKNLATDTKSTYQQAGISFTDYYKNSKVVTVNVPTEMANAKGQIVGVQKEISKSTTDTMGEVKKTVNESMGSVKKDTDTTTSDMGKDWQNAQKTITDATSGLSKATTDSMGDIKKSVDDSMKDVNKSLDSVKDGLDEKDWTFEGVAKGLKKTFEDAESGIKSIWNRIADKLNGEHEIGGGSFRINLPKFARGGFVEDGLFLANHHELVGTFSNGKTAVANNQQILDGISSGVYSAVTRAMSQQGGQSKYISNTIVVDGDVIARTVTKAQEKQNARYSPAY